MVFVLVSFIMFCNYLWITVVAVFWFLLDTALCPDVPSPSCLFSPSRFDNVGLKSRSLRGVQQCHGCGWAGVNTSEATDIMMSYIPFLLNNQTENWVLQLKPRNPLWLSEADKRPSPCLEAALVRFLFWPWTVFCFAPLCQRWVADPCSGALCCLGCCRSCRCCCWPLPGEETQAPFSGPGCFSVICCVSVCAGVDTDG